MKMFEKIKKFGETWRGMPLLLALPIAVSLLPLFGGFVFFHEDTFFIDYPFFSFFQKSIESGDSFLWNPYNFSGFPSFVGVALGFFSPLNHIIFRLFNVIDAYIIVIFLNLVLAAYLTSYFLRILGVGFWGSFIGGLVYVFVQWRIINDHSIVAVVPLIPFLFVSLWKAYSGSRRWLFFGGIVGGLVLLAGHYHYALESFVAVGISSLGIAWARGDDGWKKILFSVRNFCIMSALAFSIGAVVLFPAYVYLDYSVRAEGTAFAPWGLTPLSAIQFFSPYIDFGSSFGLFFFIGGEQKYIGILPLFFAIVGFSLWKGYRPVRFFSYFFLVSLLAAAAYSPIAALLHFLPGLSFLNSNRWMFLAYFGAAVIAGFGFDRFFSADSIVRIRRTWRLLFIGGILVWGGIVLGWIVTFLFGKRLLAFAIKYFDAYYFSPSLSFPLEHYHKYLERIFYITRSMFDLSSPKVFLAGLFFFVSMWIVRSCILSSNREFFRPLFVLVTVLNLVFVFSVFHTYLPRSAFFLPSKTAEVLSGRQDGRMLPFLPGQSEFFRLSAPYGGPVPPPVSFVFGKEMLQANTNLYYGIPSADYFDNLMSRRMSWVIAFLGASHPTVGDALVYENKKPEEKVKILESRKNMLNFVGARYVVSSYPFDESRFPKIFEERIIPPFGIPVMIYENREARPLFYFADSVEVILEDEIAAFEKLKTMSENGLGVFIECKEASCGDLFKSRHCEESRSKRDDAAISSEQKRDCFAEFILSHVEGLAMTKEGEIEIKTKKNTLSILKTKSETSQFLVFSENHLPGWKAYVDGKETPIYTVGSVYMGVMVPEGEHEIVFEFTYKGIIEEFLKKYL